MTLRHGPLEKDRSRVFLHREKNEIRLLTNRLTTISVPVIEAYRRGWGGGGEIERERERE